MKVSCIYAPERRERELFKWAVRITMGDKKKPSEPTSELIEACLNARHSPIRVLNFAFLIEEIPSNTATHFARHVHAVPFVSSLRNDRQEKMDGDLAPRNTPVDMILYCNAEELMTIANKRLCMKASEKTREAAGMICEAAAKAMPEIEKFLVPMCEYHGGVCHEITSCGKCMKG